MNWSPKDSDPTANFLVRLRVWYLMLAIVSSFYLLYLAGYVMGKRQFPNVRLWGTITRVIVVVQLIGGALNVILLAPV